MKNLLTPPNLPSGTACRTLKIPMSKEWLGIFNALLLHATKTYNWEQVNDTDLTPEECAAACYEIYEQWLGTGACPTDVEPPYWEDAENVDDDDDDGIPWYDELGDWFLTGFLAVTFTPTAGIFYKTFVPKARVALRRGDWGALFKVLINGLEYVTGDSFGAITEILEIDLDIAGFAAANGLGGAPWDLQIIHNGTGASTDPNPRLEVVRKRLDATEVNAITDIFQDQGQLLIQRGNIDVWYNVENADNVRRDGSTIITGQQQWKTGTAAGALLNLNPDAGEKAIEVKLPVTGIADLIRVLNSSGTVIFGVNTIGRFSLRGSDSAMFDIKESGGQSVVTMGSVPGNPILSVRGRALQSADIFRVLDSNAVLMAAVGSTGQLFARTSFTLSGATSTSERSMFSAVASWVDSTDATRRSKVVFNAAHYTGMKEVIAIGANAAGVPTLGFYGGSPAPQPGMVTGSQAPYLIQANLVNALAAVNIIPGGSSPNPIVPTVNGDTGDNEALISLIEGLTDAGIIVNETVAFQSFMGTITPLNGFTSVGWSSPKTTIIGETYTITVTGLISFAAGANGYSDPIWEGTPSNNLTSASGSRGEFKVDGDFIGGTEPPEMTGHAYTLDPFAGTGAVVLFQFSDYIADPSGTFTITIEGLFAS